MAAPQFDSVVDGLVTTLRAASGLGTPGDSSGDVPVYDGPVPTNEPVLTFVAVGWDGNDSQDTDTLSSTSEAWALGAAGPRREEFTTRCWLAVCDGGSDFSTLRATAATTLGLVSDAIRATPTLGVTAVEYATLNDYTVRQGVSPAGAYVGIEFVVVSVCLI